MRDRPTELDEAERFRFNLSALRRCDICGAIPVAMWSYPSDRGCVDTCGSHYCNARASRA